MYTREVYQVYIQNRQINRYVKKVHGDKLEINCEIWLLKR